MENAEQYEGSTSPLEDDLHRVVQRARQVIENADRGAEATVEQRATIARDLRKLLDESEQHETETDESLVHLRNDAQELLEKLQSN
jgi:hypothetical protein